MAVDLVAFLKDALDEDERIAKAAQPGPWTAFQHRNTAGGSVGSADARGVAHRRNYDDYASYETGEWLDHADGVHIARWDPARVLAEVAAKRELLALHDDGGRDCVTCGDAGVVGYPCPTARALVAPFASRTGFDPSWPD